MVDLVTGATGFIGSHLALALAARGGRVRALVRDGAQPGSRAAANAARLAAAGVELATGDLRDDGSLRRAVAGAERVFHAAALVTDWGRPADFRAVNVDGTRSLLAAARTAGVRRFVHLSTTDVYGFPDRPCAEDAPLRPRGWPYGDTKIAAERLVREAGRGGLAVTVVRPANVYGPGSESFVGALADLLRARRLVLIGRRPRPAGLCHVADLVAAVLRAAACPRAAGEVYNVRDGTDASWRDFADLLAAAIAAPRPRLVLPRRVAYAAAWCAEAACRPAGGRLRPPLTRMAVEILGTDQSFSIARAARHLGWRPVRTLAGSMPDLVRWLLEERRWHVRSSCRQTARST